MCPPHSPASFTPCPLLLRCSLCFALPAAASKRCRVRGPSRSAPRRKRWRPPLSPAAAAAAAGCAGRCCTATAMQSTWVSPRAGWCGWWGCFVGVAFPRSSDSSQQQPGRGRLSDGHHAPPPPDDPCWLPIAACGPQPSCRGDAAAVRGAGPPAALQHHELRLCRVGWAPRACLHGQLLGGLLLALLPVLLPPVVAAC